MQRSLSRAAASTAPTGVRLTASTSSSTAPSSTAGVIAAAWTTTSTSAASARSEPVRRSSWTYSTRSPLGSARGANADGGATSVATTSPVRASARTIASPKNPAAPVTSAFTGGTRRPRRSTKPSATSSAIASGARSSGGPKPPPPPRRSSTTSPGCSLSGGNAVSSSPFRSACPERPGSPPARPCGRVVMRSGVRLKMIGAEPTCSNAMTWPRPPRWRPAPPLSAQSSFLWKRIGRLQLEDLARA